MAGTPISLAELDMPLRRRDRDQRGKGSSQVDSSRRALQHGMCKGPVLCELGRYNGAIF